LIPGGEHARLALQRKDAAAALGIGVDTFDRHVRPELRCVYVGDVRLWPVTELERWLGARAIMPTDNKKCPRDRANGPGA
jgi:hypothetical protein